MVNRDLQVLVNLDNNKALDKLVAYNHQEANQAMANKDQDLDRLNLALANNCMVSLVKWDSQELANKATEHLNNQDLVLAQSDRALVHKVLVNKEDQVMDNLFNKFLVVDQA